MPNEWDDALRGLGLVTPDDAYDPFASEKFASPVARGALQGAAQFVATPGQLASASNPYPPGTEQSDFFERSRAQAGESWAHGAALGMLGGGTGFVRAAPGEVALGAGGAGQTWLQKLHELEAGKKAECSDCRILQYLTILASAQEAAIAKMLAQNPGASIFDLARVQ